MKAVLVEWFKALFTGVSNPGMIHGPRFTFFVVIHGQMSAKIRTVTDLPASLVRKLSQRISKTAIDSRKNSTDPQSGGRETIQVLLFPKIVLSFLR